MDELIAAAREAQKKAYAPYSHYRVGSAVRGDNGKIYQGANVENASYGLAICAERNAISAAILDGAKKIVGAAVVTSTSPPVAPCGMCRQTFSEFADDLPIALVNEKGERTDTSLKQLLPHAFRRDDLP
jgi:cytidine deaminase